MACLSAQPINTLSERLGRKAAFSCLRFADEGPLQGGDIQLLHLQHGLGRPLHRRLILGQQHLLQHFGHHLPGQAVAILQPATLLRLRRPAFTQPAPVVIDLRLIATQHLQGNGLVEAEYRPTIERREGWPCSSKATVIAVPGALP